MQAHVHAGRCPRVRNDIADVFDAGGPHQQVSSKSRQPAHEHQMLSSATYTAGKRQHDQPFETQAKARVGHGAITSQVSVPLFRSCFLQQTTAQSGRQIGCGRYSFVLQIRLPKRAARPLAGGTPPIVLWVEVHFGDASVQHIQPSTSNVLLQASAEPEEASLSSRWEPPMTCA